jgi:outer membrane protein assembly factor BamB
VQGLHPAQPSQTTTARRFLSDSGGAIEGAVGSQGGGVTALRIVDGARNWHFSPTPCPKANAVSEGWRLFLGCQASRPSPRVSLVRHVLYVTTGNNYSLPTTKTSDAVIALNLATGSIIWSRQLRAGDAFNGSCVGDRGNCPPEPGPDFDFASSAIRSSFPASHFDDCGKVNTGVCSARGLLPGSIDRGTSRRREVFYCPLGPRAGFFQSHLRQHRAVHRTRRGLASTPLVAALSAPEAAARTRCLRHEINVP